MDREAFTRSDGRAFLAVVLAIYLETKNDFKLLGTHMIPILDFDCDHVYARLVSLSPCVTRWHIPFVLAFSLCDNFYQVVRKSGGCSPP